jgi:hypothetical protein
MACLCECFISVPGKFTGQADGGRRECLAFSPIRRAGKHNAGNRKKRRLCNINEIFTP